MKIARVIPPAQPVFSMTFRRDDGWALVMALRDAHKNYPCAVDREDWKAWAEELDAELKRT